VRQPPEETTYFYSYQCRDRGPIPWTSTPSPTTVLVTSPEEKHTRTDTKSRPLRKIERNRHTGQNGPRPDETYHRL
jgi:hypothetical protein